MKYGPEYFIDKTGCTVELRNAETEDAEALIRYLKTTTAETPFLIREPEEVTLTLEQECAFIRNNIEAERELLLTALVDGEHVGNCSLMSIGNYHRYHHRCEVAIALYKEYWGRGIGRHMLERVLSIAKANGYEQAELEVIADNGAAIALYESLGFREYGRFPRNMKYKDGTYADALWMMKDLRD